VREIYPLLELGRIPMHVALLTAFFAAAIGGATGAFVRLDWSSPDFLKWLSIYILFVLYRTKIMIDDLGWYADLKASQVDPNPFDVFFAVVTWVGWFMMAAVIGQNLQYFMIFFSLTFSVSTVWIYVANAVAPEASPSRKTQCTYILLRLKDRRHVGWFLSNVTLIVSGVFCYFSLLAPANVAEFIANYISLSPATVASNLFVWGFGIAYAAFLVDVITNMKEFKKALQSANRV
jgi:hypothetical protein